VPAAQTLVAILLLPAAAHAGIPPITDGNDWSTLRLTRDFEHEQLDPAVVPLLQNAVWWDAWDAAGAAAPDYAALLKTPPEFRGHLFLVRGAVARIKRVDHMPFRGPWDAKDGKVQEYDILVDQPHGQVVVVLLADAPPEAQQPKKAQRIEVVARFYKVFRNKIRRGEEGAVLDQEEDFPEFVGKTVLVSAAPPPAASPGAGLDAKAAAGVLLILVLAAVLVFVLRKKLSGAGESSALMAARGRLERARAAASASAPEAAGEPQLPKDPAAALEELERRRRAGSPHS
jgi:hypothetical protein